MQYSWAMYSMVSWLIITVWQQGSCRVLMGFYQKNVNSGCCLWLLAFKISSKLLYCHLQDRRDLPERASTEISHQLPKIMTCAVQRDILQHWHYHKHRDQNIVCVAGSAWQYEIPEHQLLACICACRDVTSFLYVSVWLCTVAKKAGIEPLWLLLTLICDGCFLYRLTDGNEYLFQAKDDVSLFFSVYYWWGFCAVGQGEIKIKTKKNCKELRSALQFSGLQSCMYVCIMIEESQMQIEVDSSCRCITRGVPDDS